MLGRLGIKDHSSPQVLNGGGVPNNKSVLGQSDQGPVQSKLDKSPLTRGQFFLVEEKHRSNRQVRANVKPQPGPVFERRGPFGKWSK